MILSILLGISSFCRAEFNSFPLASEGRISAVAFKDMDGDGKLEIVVAAQKSGAGGVRTRTISVMEEKGGSYSAQKTLDVPDDVISFSLGDFLGEGKPQVVYITANAVLALPNAGGEPVRLISNHRFFFNRPSKENLSYWDYALDLNKDKLDDLVLADGRGYVVYLQIEKQKLVAHGRIEGEFNFATQGSETIYNETFENNQSNQRELGDRKNRSGPPPKIAKGAGWLAAASPIVTERSIGRLFFGDVNGDARTDLMLLKRDKLLALVQKTDGIFNSKNDLTLQLGPKGAKQAWDESRWPVASGDVNGDGRSDFVISEVDAKDLSTKLRIYFWGDAGIPAEPNQIIKLSGLGEAARLNDVNGDGRLDLCYLTLRADKMLQLKKAEVEEIDASQFVYLYDPAAGMFRKKPDIKHEYAVKLGGDMEDDREQKFSHFKGDYNGDGTRDLLTFENRGELLIYFTTAGGKDKMDLDMPSKPSLKVPVASPPRDLWVVDIDANGKSDVITRGREQLTVLRAK